MILPRASASERFIGFPTDISPSLPSAGFFFFRLIFGGEKSRALVVRQHDGPEGHPLLFHAKNGDNGK